MQSSDLPCTTPDEEVPYSSGKVENRFWNQVDHPVCHELTSKKWQADCGNIQGLIVQVQSLGRFTSIRFIVYEPGRFTLASEEGGGGEGAHRLLLTHVSGGKVSPDSAHPTHDVRTLLPSSRQMTNCALTSFGINLCT
jgi:hypothetical protein